MKALSFQTIYSLLGWTEIVVPEEANAVLPKSSRGCQKWLQEEKKKQKLNGCGYGEEQKTKNFTKRIKV